MERTLSESAILQLWHSFKKGEQEAYQQLYEIYFDKLFYYGRKFTKDTGIIEDAIHDLFLRLWKNRANISVPHSVKNYLFKALRNHLIDKITHLRSQHKQEFQEDFPFFVELSPEQRYITSEQDKKIHQSINTAFEALTARQKEVLYLRYFEEFTYDEIAHMLHITTKATYKLMARAIDELKSLLKDSENNLLFIIMQLRKNTGFY